jgi:gluconolactonase
MMFGEIEGTGFEVIDASFRACFIGHIRVERLWTGARWCEGPAWFAAGRYLVWSDIPNNRLMRWDEPSGHVSVFRDRSNNANGNSVDNQGRLVTCEHLTRRVTRTEVDGSITVLADRWQGKRLNSPNDVVVRSDDSIWFTDPSYGIITDYEGDYGEQEIPGSYVYRIDPNTGTVERMIDDMVQPNGLAFSADESLLYVSDTGVTHRIDGPRDIRRYRVAPGGKKVVDGELFAPSTAGFFDGFRVDRRDRIWTSAGDGVHCYNPEGTLIGKVLIPETVGNVTFGSTKRNRLFICATSSLYSVYLATNGTRLG